MKTLELNLQKRLLIVEVGEIEEIIDVQPDFNTALLQGKKFIAVKGNHKLICKGSELTEEIAKGLVHQSIHTGLFAHYVKDIPVNTYCYKSALNSFISAIEAQGYYWGENTLDTECDRLVSDNSALGCAKYRKAFHEWQEAESKTFNLEKTLIFEIL